MNIALISYEYPPDTAIGGISTYVHQAARMLRDRGHHSEVFAGSRERSGCVIQEEIAVHRVIVNDAFGFANLIGPVFAQRHAEAAFDVIEAPEFKADAREAIRLVPDIALVVKLHTPTYLIEKLNPKPLPLAKKLRLMARVARHGRDAVEVENAIERRHTFDADRIAVPSVAIGDEVARDWKLDKSKIDHVPNLYTPSPALLEIPVETQSDVVSFFGRLETRKGVLDFARAIPLVLREYPTARFRFVGKPLRSPDANLDMRQYLEKTLQEHASAIEFRGPVAPDEIPALLAQTDICAFPSVWENFPNVCLEAMAAARGVIGSNAGGMAEQLDDGRVGRLVSPRQPTQVASAILELLRNPNTRITLGRNARERVLSEYNATRIGVLQEECYTRAIEARRKAGPRRA